MLLITPCTMLKLCLGPLGLLLEKELRAAVEALTTLNFLADLFVLLSSFQTFPRGQRVTLKATKIL